MHEVVIVHISDSAGYVVKNSSGFLLRYKFVLDDELKKFFARAQFGGDVDKGSVFEVLIHFHDIGVVLYILLCTSFLKILNSLMISFYSRGLLRHSICFIARMLPS